MIIKSPHTFVFQQIREPCKDVKTVIPHANYLNLGLSLQQFQHHTAFVSPRLSSGVQMNFGEIQPLLSQQLVNSVVENSLVSGSDQNSVDIRIVDGLAG